MENYTLAFVLYNEPVLSKDITKAKVCSLSEQPTLLKCLPEKLLEADIKILPPIPMDIDPEEWVPFVSEVIDNASKTELGESRDYGPLTYLLRIKSMEMIAKAEQFYFCSPVIIHAKSDAIDTALVKASYEHHKFDEPLVLTKYQELFFLEKLNAISLVVIG